MLSFIQFPDQFRQLQNAIGEEGIKRPVPEYLHRFSGKLQHVSEPERIVTLRQNGLLLRQVPGLGTICSETPEY
jgi:hypothetical protein